MIETIPNGFYSCRLCGELLSDSPWSDPHRKRDCLSSIEGLIDTGQLVRIGKGLETGVAQLDSEPGKDGAEVPGVTSSSRSNGATGDGSQAVLSSVEQRSFSPLGPGSSPGSRFESFTPYQERTRIVEFLREQAALIDSDAAGRLTNDVFDVRKYESQRFAIAALNRCAVYLEHCEHWIIDGNR